MASNEESSKGNKTVELSSVVALNKKHADHPWHDLEIG
jgi:hypothetical protein